MKDMNRFERGEYLRRTVHFNEEIKHVVCISSGINLTAINAILVARRAGGRSRGYGVVSNELRNFSRKLDGLMTETAQLVSGMVRDVASLLKHERSKRQMDRAAHMTDEAAGLLDVAMGRKGALVSEAKARIREKLGQLDRRTVRALKLSHGATVLARSAKIEAVYGCDMAVALGQVSVEIEAQMDELLGRLKLLNANLQAWQTE